MSSGRILVVEDNPDISEMLKIILTAEGYEVFTALDGTEAMAVVRVEPLDLILLDLMLPLLDGMEVCRRTREVSTVPIIMVTARTDEEHKIQGFGAGADDYVEKPFKTGELLARVRALLRRSRGVPNEGGAVPRVVLGGMVLDPNSLTVTVDGRDVRATRLEFDLLHALGQRPGRVMSRDQLLELVWSGQADVQPRCVDVHVRRVRLKIEADPRHPKRLQTVHSVGYKLVAV